MATLFVARDRAGLTRFIGDVQRGAACGCYCPVCASPLVAKQGGELEWHFAHEAGTEAPECRAGAMNLLRRVVLEELGRGGLSALPPYRVPHPLGGRGEVVWTAHAGAELEVLDVHGSQTASAQLPLREGGTALIYVCIDSETPPSSAASDQAVLVASCPVPAYAAVRTEAQAREFARSSLRLHWLAVPDFEGRLAAAQAEAREFMEKLQRERAHQAGARWAATRRALQSPPPLHLAVPGSPAPPAGQRHAADALVAAPDWAPGLQAGTSIHYRALDDGSQWVCFQHAPNEWRLRPVPTHHEGWDESFPPAIAVMEEDACLRVVDFGKLLLLFNAHAKASQIDSDPEVIARLFRK